MRFEEPCRHALYLSFPSPEREASHICQRLLNNGYFHNIVNSDKFSTKDYYSTKVAKFACFIFSAYCALFLVSIVLFFSAYCAISVSVLLGCHSQCCGYGRTVVQLSIEALVTLLS